MNDVPIDPGIREVRRLFETLQTHERRLQRSFSLIPSENNLSSLAHLPFLSDAYVRYFFDEREAFGRWSFEGGSIAGQVQKEIVVPTLRELGQARFVNVHPISGLTGMTLALASFGGVTGSHVFSIAPGCGGHPDTSYVAAKLGYQTHSIPFVDWESVDLEAMGVMVSTFKPTLVYVDHATALAPLPLADIVGVVKKASDGQTHVHVDSSHVNGLVWGRAFENPLACGADTYGGSTHKTFFGPHKGVLFTNDEECAERLLLTAVNMISHHHTASVLSLGVALLEFKYRGGSEYAHQVLDNAEAFANGLRAAGVGVQQLRDGTPTKTHQVWIDVAPDDAYVVASRLFEVGLVVNPFNPLPSLGGPGIRIGVNEPTRLGMSVDDMADLAVVVAAALHDGATPLVKKSLQDLRGRAVESYSFSVQEVQSIVGGFIQAVGNPFAVASHAT